MSVDVAVAALRSAGYQLVRRDVPVAGGRSRLHVDVVAWGADETGELVPQVAVEVTRGGDADALPGALQQLSISRDLLGTRHHYAFLGGVWYAADAGLVSATPVDGPEPSSSHGIAKLTDPTLVTQMVGSRLFQLADRHRGSSAAGTAMLAAALQLIDEVMEHGGLVMDGQVVRVEQSILAESLFDGIPAWMTRADRGSGEYLTLPPAGRALARLLRPVDAGVVLDPFCGSGSLLWHARQAAVPDTRLTLAGQDLNETIATLARRLGCLIPGGMDLQVGDSLVDDLPVADYVITQPPLIPRLPQPYRLANGQSTNDWDLAVLDRCLRTLRPGGRAVVHITRGWLWRESASGYRRWLAEHARVVALIGLPAGAFAGSNLDSVVTVLAAAPPAETFVAQLGPDWITQLADDGPALAAYSEHLRDS